jgi:hypothetical protein
MDFQPSKEIKKERNKENKDETFNPTFQSSKGK